MCEIAILQPDQRPANRLAQIAMNIYSSMRSSLGICAVQNGWTFSYDIFRDTEPTLPDVRDFFSEHSDPMFYIIHGRLATRGEVVDEHAHPLRVDCDECNVDYVIHNGIITGFRELREKHAYDGHEYNTGVDSEAIAHEVTTVPENFNNERASRFKREPAYILLNEERIYIEAPGRGYVLTDTPEMAQPHRDFGPSVREDNYSAILVEPNG